MKLQTLFKLITSGQLALIGQLQPAFSRAYQASFLTAAISTGLLSLLRDGPLPLQTIHQRLIGLSAGDPASIDRLHTWLEAGVSLGVLKHRSGGYALASRLARQLADPRNDAMAAMYEEVHTLHHELLAQTPSRLRAGRIFDPAETDGELIARSSRILEPFTLDTVDAFIPPTGSLSLLEVGCGSGVYIRRACQRNPQLRVVGLELQPRVAEFARQNLTEWGLAARARIDCGDIRAYVSAERFDLLTLHNNIYYFPTAERLDLLRQLAGFLKPGGQLLITTACQGYTATNLLNLWGEMTEGAGPLPQANGLIDLLGQAGLSEPRKTELLPGSGFYAFTARNA